tara:strand:- start:15983 stop:16540 length:558 start_codon:yes stop_codon:yes gene_type:complete
MNIVRKELPKEYKNALTGYKKQAYFASKTLRQKVDNGYTNLSESEKKELVKAQQLMYDNPIATKHIYKILTEENINIDEIDENSLFDFLIKKESFSLSHLTGNPLYYVAYTKVDDVEYYFITKYFNDVKSFGGHSGNYEESLSMLKKSVTPERLNFTKNIELKNKLLNSLKEPNLVATIAILEEN